MLYFVFWKKKIVLSIMLHQTNRETDYRLGIFDKIVVRIIAFQIPKLVFH